MEQFICKCCGNDARWCGDGENACGVEHCAHVHCDHCGMHYSLESEAALGVETMEEDRALMSAAYNVLIQPGRTILKRSQSRLRPGWNDLLSTERGEE